jgi:hypothetical protein
MKTPAMELGLEGARWSRALAIVQGESHVVLHVREEASAAAATRPAGEPPAPRVVHVSAEQAATGRCVFLQALQLSGLHALPASVLR